MRAHACGVGTYQTVSLLTCAITGERIVFYVKKTGGATSFREKGLDGNGEKGIFVRCLAASFTEL